MNTQGTWKWNEEENNTWMCCPVCDCRVLFQSSNRPVNNARITSIERVSATENLNQILHGNRQSLSTSTGELIKCAIKCETLLKCSFNSEIPTLAVSLQYRFPTKWNHMLVYRRKVLWYSLLFSPSHPTLPTDISFHSLIGPQSRT